MLEVSNLRVRLQTQRGPAEAIRGVSFGLQRGETLGLVGESGCGKSMTAMALMGLLPESAVVSGSILLDGQELAGQPDAVLRHIRGNRIGMLFQEPMTALNPVHSIGDQVAEPMRLHRGMTRQASRARAIELLERVGIPQAARQRAIELLARVGIPEPARRIDSFPHQFSGGQRQRIMIAMALACEPDLLIADEPTTALDVTIQGQILDLIQDLVQERAMALVLISHDLGLIAQNVRRMLVMYGGAVVESGPADAVFRQPAHPYTRGLLAARPNLAQRLRAHRSDRLPTIAGTVPELFALPPGCPFAGRCPFTEHACWSEAPPRVDLDGAHRFWCRRAEAVLDAPESIAAGA